jgi:transposase
MISQEQVDQVRQLLAVGKSYREIAAAVGVSRGTVGGIASGTRVDRPDWPLPRMRRPSAFALPIVPRARLCPHRATSTSALPRGVGCVARTKMRRCPSAQ